MNQRPFPPTPVAAALITAPLITAPLITALLITVLPVTALAQRDDSVFSSSGTVRGTILAMSPTEVTVDTSSGERRVAVNTIRKIEFGDEQGELDSARDKVARQQLEDALEDLAKINLREVQRDVIKQDIEFFRAYCRGRLALSGGGDKTAAHDELLAFARANAGSFHFFQAAELLGDLAVAMEKYEEATKYYGSIARAPWPDYQMKSKVLEAKALVAQEDFQAAQTRYEDVIKMDLDTAEATMQKLFAAVGKATCVVELADPKQAIATLEKIIAENDPEANADLFARAYNAMGSAYRKTNQPREALLAYLHVDKLFYQNPDAHAEALYYLTQLWTQVDKPERANNARGLLRQQYGGSNWAKK